MPKANSVASVPNAVNSNKQHNVENQDSTVSDNTAFIYNHSLSKYQCQKWQQIFDIEKVLKQIRMAEKIYIKGKCGGSNGTDNSHKSSNSSNNSPPSRSKKNPIRQVQRLNGTDMHYYGIVPKQNALDVVVCSVCMGIYTKVGLNNHMMLQHPSIWTNVSAKVTPPANDINLGTNDNSQDSVKEIDTMQNIAVVTVQNDVMASPSDLSGTMSSCSNASSSSVSTVSSAVLSVNYTAPLTTTTNSRQKNSLKAGSSSGSNNSSSRSRSKSKHHSSAISATTSASPNANTEMSYSSAIASNSSTASNKKNSSKKNSSSLSSSNANSSSTSAIANGNGIANNNVINSNTPLILTEIIESKVLACGTILPASITANTTTITLSSTAAAITKSTTNANSAILDASQNNSSTTTCNANPFGSSSSSSSSSCSSNSSYSLPPTPKMITNYSSLDSQQIGQLNTKTEAFSPTVSEGKEKISLTTGGDNMSLTKKKIKSPVAVFGIPGNVEAVKTEAFDMPRLRMISQQPLNHYDAQLTELDQAISSIIVGPSNGNENKLNSATNAVNAGSTSTMEVKVDHSICPVRTGTQQDTQQHQIHTEDGQLVHNTSDDSAMLNHVLDVMLDSKLINEILNAETELNFDENVLNDSSSAAHSANQHQQAEIVYLEQPLTKRMRFDETTNMGRLQQHLSVRNHDIADEFTVFQQQQTQQTQAQYAQYDGSAMSDTLNMDSQYQTPIEAIQLQQLLYQQHIGGNIGLQHHQQNQQIYDSNGGTVVDTKRILELCGDTVGVQPNGNEFLKAEKFVTLPEDVSHQFQIFNIPSLTDDIDPEIQPHQEEVTHHIIEQQFVMPVHEETEEQLIYEITNNSIATMSQQHQQQVLAEFLNEAASKYEQHRNQQLQQVSHYQEHNFVEDGTNKSDKFYDYLLDFDFSMIETVKSLGSSSNSISTTAGNTNASVKSERNNILNASSTSSPSIFKYHEDFFFNVFFYTGIPRPLAVNTFGLIKLPQCVATTFRKHLLTVRKANNSLMSLGGGSLNGVMGQTSSATAAGTVSGRFSNSKQLPSYFTNLANNGGSNSVSNNEFSIGSITITNTLSNVQQQGSTSGSQQQSNKQNSSSGTSNHVEINLNGGIPTTSSIPRGRTKSGSYNSLSSNNLKHKASGALVNSTNATRVIVGTIGPYNAKTIFVSNAATLNAERNKFIKRSLIAKIHLDPTRTAQSYQGQQQHTSKTLWDFLNSKKSANNSDANSLLSDQEISSQFAAERQAKLNRLNRFYERRKNLQNIAQNRHTPYQRNPVLRRHQLEQQLHPQQQHQKLLKQQLMRNFSDCGINSAPNNSVTSTDSNVMRVFV